MPVHHAAVLQHSRLGVFMCSSGVSQCIAIVESCLPFCVCLPLLPQVHSPNLLDWRIATTVLVPSDGRTWEQSLWQTGYQYAGGAVQLASYSEAV
jgi:hypothetical protein